MSSPEVVRYHTDAGIRPALVLKGRRWLSVLMIDAGSLRLLRVPKSEARFMHSMDYPLDRAIRKFRKAGRELGSNKASRRFLQRATR